MVTNQMTMPFYLCQRQEYSDFLYIQECLANPTYWHWWFVSPSFIAMWIHVDFLKASNPLFLKYWCTSNSLRVLIKINIPWPHSADLCENQWYAYLRSISGDSDADGVGACFGNRSMELHIQMLASRWLGTSYKKPLSDSNEIDHLLNLMLYSKWKLQKQT